MTKKEGQPTWKVFYRIANIPPHSIWTHITFQHKRNQFNFILFRRVRQKNSSRRAKPSEWAESSEIRLQPKTEELRILPRQAVALILISFFLRVSVYLDDGTQQNENSSTHRPYGVCVFMHCSQLSVELYENVVMFFYSLCLSRARVCEWVRIRTYVCLVCVPIFFHLWLTDVESKFNFTSTRFYPFGTIRM